jgi:hypothetical protein
LQFLLAECKPENLKQQELGTLIHLLFMLMGDSKEIGGFRTNIRGVLDLGGHQIVWADPSEPAEETKPAEKVEVIN